MFTLMALAGGTLLLASSPPALAATTAGAIATAGTNLIQNGGAETGDRSDTGWDAVTIPGWQIVSGLPSVIGYGTKNFVGSAFASRYGGNAIARKQMMTKMMNENAPSMNI